MEIFSFVLRLLEGEYWWGGIVHDGNKMPIPEGFMRNLSTDQFANQTAPLLLSNKGRYIWSEDAFAYEMKDGCLHLTAEQVIDIGEGYENLRGAYLAACQKFFPPTGTTPDRLLFTEPQFNAWIEMTYEPTSEKMISYAETILEMGMPAGVIMIDDNWQEDYGVWNFHQARFAEPKKTISKLHELGFKVMLWVCNYISPDSLTFRSLDKMGYLVKNKEGKPAVIEWWNGYSGLLDLTNPKAVEWFKGKLDRLVTEYGVDGFKFDAGDSVVYRDEFITARKVSGNEYCNLWAQIGLNYSLNEYRACWKMGGQPLMQRLCDKHHTWDKERGVASLIPNGLMQGLLGYGYNCPDMIGGGDYLCFEDNPDMDEELVVRYAQCSALFPMMQFSVSPWRILSKENLRYCVEAAQLHHRFGEYIYELAKHCAQAGEPITRHMEYVFGGCGYETIDDQFMLGDTILVAPVVEKGVSQRKVVFPAGSWKMEDGEVIQGPCEKIVDAPTGKLLWYEKR